MRDILLNKALEVRRSDPYPIVQQSTIKIIIIITFQIIGKPTQDPKLKSKYSEYLIGIYITLIGLFRIGITFICIRLLGLEITIAIDTEKFVTTIGDNGTN